METSYGRAMSRMIAGANATRKYCGISYEVLFADGHSDQVSGVCKDEAGHLWLCRLENADLFSVEYTGSTRFFLMPVYGPCPDPIEFIPRGYSVTEERLLIGASIERRQTA